MKIDPSSTSDPLLDPDFGKRTKLDPLMWTILWITLAAVAMILAWV